MQLPLLQLLCEENLLTVTVWPVYFDHAQKTENIRAVAALLEYRRRNHGGTDLFPDKFSLENDFPIPRHR